MDREGCVPQSMGLQRVRHDLLTERPVMYMFDDFMNEKNMDIWLTTEHKEI